MERAIVDNSTYVKELLSDLVLYFLHLTFNVEVGIILHKLTHPLIHLLTLILVRKLLKVLRGDTRDQVFDVSVRIQSCLYLIEGAFHVTDVHVDRLSFLVNTILSTQDTFLQGCYVILITRVFIF